MNRKFCTALSLAVVSMAPSLAYADAISAAGAAKSSFDPIAVGMFACFVILTLGIT